MSWLNAWLIPWLDKGSDQLIGVALID